MLKLKEMLDTFSNDFNGMVFFVNNVGAGVQDIRTIAEQNQRDIRNNGGSASAEHIQNMTSFIMLQVNQKIEDLGISSLQDLLDEQEESINGLKIKLEVEQQKTEWLMGENQKLYYSLDEMNVTLQSQQPSVIFLSNNSSSNGSTPPLPSFVDAPMIVPIIPGLAGSEGSAVMNESLSRIETVEESVNRVSALMTTIQGGIKRLDTTLESKFYI